MAYWLPLCFQELQLTSDTMAVLVYSPGQYQMA